MMKILQHVLAWTGFMVVLALLVLVTIGTSVYLTNVITAYYEISQYAPAVALVNAFGIVGIILGVIAGIVDLFVKDSDGSDVSK